MLQGFGFGEVVGIFDQKEDAADFMEGRYGAAWHNRQVWSEGGDGNEAEVGGAALEFGSAVCRRGGVKGVASGQFGGVGRVLEVVQEGSGVEKADCGYAKHNSEGTGFMESRSFHFGRDDKSVVGCGNVGLRKGW